MFLVHFLSNITAYEKLQILFIKIKLTWIRGDAEEALLGGML
jgi:hypothetical protein